jgi:hypothetical protein
MMSAGSGGGVLRRGGGTARQPYGGVQTNQQVEKWVRGRKVLDEKCIKENPSAVIADVGPTVAFSASSANLSSTAPPYRPHPRLGSCGVRFLAPARMGNPPERLDSALRGAKMQRVPEVL